MSNLVTVRLSRETWKEIQSQREPNETIDETVRRLLDDRRRYGKLIKENGGSTLNA